MKVWFEYGTDTSYGNQTYRQDYYENTESGQDGCGSGTWDGSPLQYLAPNTRYHVRAVAQEGDQTYYGPDVTFSTGP